VAVTRAKLKLIMFGSKDTLRAAPVFASLFDLLEEKDWIFHLSPDSLSQHILD
jgi:superfamily I DNA and/or RNA helicase